MRRAARIAKLLVIAAIVLCPAAAAASAAGAEADAEAAKRECLARHEEAQIARRDRRMIDARADLRLCSAAACPGAIRADCLEWLDQVARTLPSVVVSARARGQDLSAVKVFVDSKLAAERLSGAALELDPGEHRFRFEAPPWPPVERTVLVSEGVQNRPVDVEFAPPPAPPPPAPAVAPAEAPPLPPRERHFTRFDWIVGGVGAAAVVSAGLFAGWGVIQRSDFENGGCAPFCTADEKSSVRTKLVIADASLGLAAVSFAVVYFHVMRSGEPASPSRRRAALLLDAAPDGARLFLRGTF
jgi:hypothetical protein